MLSKNKLSEKEKEYLRDYMKKYYKKNKEKLKEKMREWYKENKGWQKNYNQNHKDKIRESYKKWYSKNKSIHEKKLKTRRLNSQIKIIMYEYFGVICMNCGDTHNLEVHHNSYDINEIKNLVINININKIKKCNYDLLLYELLKKVIIVCESCHKNKKIEPNKGILKKL